MRPQISQMNADTETHDAGNLVPNCLGNSIALLVLLFFTLTAQAALPNIWPPNIKAPQPAELAKQCAALDTASLPAELKPAAQFQKTFLKILASKPPKAQLLEQDWVAELRAFIAADRENNPVAHGVAEVARAWLARVQMQAIDAALHQYYRQNVHFPDQFSAIQARLPEPLRLDPWGQPWVYEPRAPQGISKLALQRYHLGAAKFLSLGTLSDTVSQRHSILPAWKITLRNLGDKPALEIRIAASSATLQPGGKTGDHTLLYIGENWALFAGPDQLFAVPF